MTIQEEIREELAHTLAYYACCRGEERLENLNAFKKQVYLDQAVSILEALKLKGVVIETQCLGSTTKLTFTNYEPLTTA